MNNENPANVTAAASSSLKHKSSLLGKPAADEVLTAPLKYLSNFFRPLELPLTNCKIYL